MNRVVSLLEISNELKVCNAAWISLEKSQLTCVSKIKITWEIVAPASQLDINLNVNVIYLLMLQSQWKSVWDIICVSHGAGESIQSVAYTRETVRGRYNLYSIHL